MAFGIEYLVGAIREKKQEALAQVKELERTLFAKRARITELNR